MADLHRVKAVAEGFMGQSGGTVRVSCALNTSVPDAATLERLEHLGLSIDRRIGNKLLGSVLQSRMAALKADASVDEVQLSVPLAPKLLSGDK